MCEGRGGGGFRSPVPDIQSFVARTRRNGLRVDPSQSLGASGACHCKRGASLVTTHALLPDSRHRLCCQMKTGVVMEAIRSGQDGETIMAIMDRFFIASQADGPITEMHRGR